jgi:hypothetical protein
MDLKTQLSVRMQNNLLSHAHAENRNLAAKVLDGLVANTGIPLWMSRARADYQLGRLLGDQVVECDFVIAVYGHGRALKDEVLVDIPGEGIVVVNENNVGSGRYWWRRVRISRRMVDQLEGRHRVYRGAAGGVGVKESRGAAG